ncbi:MAG TPA: hypothetical protein VL424_08790, partial [Pararobbsia sp.]|nr:hypothetical protein [Pararobbsia sp.]
MGWNDRDREHQKRLSGFPASPARPAFPALIVALLVAAACSNKPPDNPEQYASRLTSERAAKDAEFRRDDD